jgi:hypothetical protein
MLLPTEILSFTVTYYNFPKLEVDCVLSKLTEFQIIRTGKIKILFFVVTTLTLKMGVVVFFINFKNNENKLRDASAQNITILVPLLWFVLCFKT